MIFLHGKTKKLSSFEKWGFGEEGTGSCGIQRPENQELSATAPAVSLITMKCSET